MKAMEPVPDLPQGQLGPGPGPEIQGAWNHESKKKERNYKAKHFHNIEQI